MLAWYMLCVHLSVCPSQARIVSKQLDELSWFLAQRLPSPCPTPYYKEIWISPKMTVLPSGNLFKTPDLKNFAMVSRSHCQQSSSLHRRSSLLTHLYDSRQVVAVYYKSISCNPQTPLLRFFVDLLYDLFLRSTQFWLTACHTACLW